MAFNPAILPNSAQSLSQTANTLLAESLQRERENIALAKQNKQEREQAEATLGGLLRMAEQQGVQVDSEMIAKAAGGSASQVKGALAAVVMQLDQAAKDQQRKLEQQKLDDAKAWHSAMMPYYGAQTRSIETGLANAQDVRNRVALFNQFANGYNPQAAMVDAATANRFIATANNPLARNYQVIDAPAVQPAPQLARIDPYYVDRFANPGQVQAPLPNPEMLSRYSGANLYPNRTRPLTAEELTLMGAQAGALGIPEVGNIIGDVLQAGKASSRLPVSFQEVQFPDGTKGMINQNGIPIWKQAKDEEKKLPELVAVRDDQGKVIPEMWWDKANGGWVRKRQDGIMEYIERQTTTTTTAPAGNTPSATGPRDPYANTNMGTIEYFDPTTGTFHR